MGAKEVSPAEAPELHAMIERLCVQADLPKPTIAVADTPMPNAFAMGRSQKHATVVRDDRHPGAALARPSSRASWPTRSPTSSTATW